MRSRRCVHPTDPVIPHSSYYIQDSFAALPDALREVCEVAPGKLCVVSDAHVASLYLEDLQNALPASIAQVDPFVFPEGEESKSEVTLFALYRHLQEQDIERGDLLLALGGGVVGDLTGYAAATYLRGIRYLQIPTTLLAMADSCYGGKCGIDLDGAKNRIGTYYDPVGQYLSLHTLQTLHEMDFRCGLAEIVKTAVVGNAPLFSLLETQTDALLQRDPAVLSRALMDTLGTKAAIVAQDPYDNGIRHVLNFGHTIGHALETVSAFAIPHGIAVSLGMTAALSLSEETGVLSSEERGRIEIVQKALGLPVRIRDLAEVCSLDGQPAFPSALQEALSEEEIVAQCRFDKKRERGDLLFVLLPEIGNATYGNRVEEESLRKAIHELFA